MAAKKVLPVAAAYRRFVAAMGRRYEATRSTVVDEHGKIKVAHPGNEAARKAAGRDMWQAVSDALAAYAHKGNTEAFPQEIAHKLHSAIEDFLAGRPPEELTNELSFRGRRPSPQELIARRYVAAYMFAAKNKDKIKDKSPNKTIRNWYGITAKAVNNWENQYPELTLADVLPDLPAKERAEALIALTQKCGEWYRTMVRKEI